MQSLLPGQPIATAAAWRGDELFDRADWMHELDQEEFQEVSLAIEKLNEYSSQRIESDDFIPVDLPKLKSRLLRIQDSLENGSGATIVRGLPVDADSHLLKHLFFQIASHVGTPVSQSAKGERVFSVRNEGFAADDPRARGPNTKKRLSFHTDRCDVIAFLCVKQAKSGGENQVVSSVSIFNEMLQRHADLLQILMQPFYYQRHNVDIGNESPFTKQPIFSIHEGHFAANLLRVLIDRAYADPSIPDMTDQQREALDLVEAIAAEKNMHCEFTQQPGDMLFLNNWVTLHRRNEFEDFSELDRRRHLLRIWLSMPNSRPLDPLFAGNYGATAAGAIRGGMRAVTD